MEVDRVISSFYSTSSSLAIPLILLLSISYGYCYFLVKKLPKGFPRLFSLLPVFYILFIVPWCFPTSIFLRALTSFFLTWISSFKLLLFSFDRGDLILCNSYIDFVAIASLPLRIKPKYASEKAPFLHRVEPVLKLLLFLVPFSVLISVQFAMLLMILSLLKPRLEVVPIFNQLHRSTSPQVFWGRRWNRISSDVLRYTTYEPTIAFLKGFIGVNIGRMVALMTCLVVSGLMHEIMFYHMSCGMKPTWEVTHFFVVQGLCMVLEDVIKGFWARTLRRPPVRPIISVPLTLSFMLVTSYWLLVLPVWRIKGRRCHGDGYGLKFMEKLLRILEIRTQVISMKW